MSVVIIAADKVEVKLVAAPVAIALTLVKVLEAGQVAAVVAPPIITAICRLSFYQQQQAIF